MKIFSPFHFLAGAIILLLLPACKCQLPQPKLPPIKKIDCINKLKKFQSSICKDNDNYYICFNYNNAQNLKYDLLVLKQCVRLYEEKIDFYNKIILERRD
jgi:hypothetical protein